MWRSCWRGDETWLNQVERGREYRAGDEWGCIGRWFSGRWYTQPSLEYIAAVEGLLPPTDLADGVVQELATVGRPRSSPTITGHVDAGSGRAPGASRSAPPPPPNVPPPPPPGAGPAWSSAGGPVPLAPPPQWATQTAPPRPKAPTAAWLLIGGAVVMVLGSFLTWFTIGGEDITGFSELGGEDRDGPAFVVFAVILAGFGITTLLARRLLPIAILAVVFAGFSSIFALVDYGDISDLEDVGLVEAGPGVPIVIVGDADRPRRRDRRVGQTPPLNPRSCIYPWGSGNAIRCKFRRLPPGPQRSSSGSAGRAPSSPRCRAPSDGRGRRRTPSTARHPVRRAR